MRNNVEWKSVKDSIFSPFNFYIGVDNISKNNHDTRSNTLAIVEIQMSHVTCPVEKTLNKANKFTAASSSIFCS